MTDPPKKRRRWPWIVLIVALCFGSGLSWWYWPRGDARFVGQWLMYDGSDSEAVGMLALYRHGMGRFTASDVTGNMSISFQWGVEGDSFYFGPKKEGDAHRYVEWFAEFLMDSLGHSFVPSQDRYTFKILDENTIRLDDGSTEPSNLRRMRGAKELVIPYDVPTTKAQGL